MSEKEKVLKELYNIKETKVNFDKELAEQNVIDLISQQNYNDNGDGE